MYCHHCGYNLNEHKVEMASSSFKLVEGVTIDEDTKVQYICPRCGHLIHDDLSLEERKSLSRASHSQVQRGSNSFASGMCLNAIGVILAIISFIFFKLSDKPNAGFVTNCGEFYVAVATAAIAIILIAFGLYKTISGMLKKKHYLMLLKEINNNTFIQ
jgi:hypothetical protein